MLRAILGLSGRKHLNLSLPAAPGYDARVIERPGLWMPQAELQGILAEMRALAARATPGGGLSYGVLSGAQERLDRAILTLVRDREGRLVAFNALSVMDLTLGRGPVQVLHLGLVLIDPGARARGLTWVLYGLTCFLLLVRGGLRPVWVSNVTQVPAIVGMVADSFGQVFPAPARSDPALPAKPPARRSLTHLLLARRIMADHRAVFGVGPEAGFDEDRFVITNAYTGGSEGLKKGLGDCAPHRDPAFTAYCAAALDYDRGDDLLQIGVADLPTAFDYLKKSVPRRSVARLGLVTAGVVLNRLVRPVVEWLDAGQESGLLRARAKA
jgi:hypothetical protein